MRYFRTCSRILTYPLLALFLFTTVPLVPAQAALIGTEDVLQQRDLSAAREHEFVVDCRHCPDDGLDGAALDHMTGRVFRGGRALP